MIAEAIGVGLQIGIFSKRRFQSDFQSEERFAG
jgi:hypothetical protein